MWGWWRQSSIVQLQLLKLVVNGSTCSTTYEPLLLSCIIRNSVRFWAPSHLSLILLVANADHWHAEHRSLHRNSLMQVVSLCSTRVSQQTRPSNADHDCMMFGKISCLVIHVLWFFTQNENLLRTRKLQRRHELRVKWRQSPIATGTSPKVRYTPTLLCTYLHEPSCTYRTTTKPTVWNHKNKHEFVWHLRWNSCEPNFHFFIQVHWTFRPKRRFKSSCMSWCYHRFCT